MKKIFSILLLAIGLVSCDDVVKDNPVKPVIPDVKYEITDIVITGDSISAEGTVTLTVGTSLKLAVELTPQPTKSIKLVWTSSDESLLTISRSGLLKAKAPGTVVVTVSPADYPDVSATITVTIVDADDESDDDAGDESDDDAGDESDDDAGDESDDEVDVGEGTADQSKAEARS